jgi:hypothetical protein
LIPGTFKVIDYNASGSIELIKDQAPTGYTIAPQNTWSLTLGATRKGLDFSLQFYSVYNVSGQNDDLRAFGRYPGVALVYPINRDEAWTPERAANGTAKNNLLMTTIETTNGNYIMHDYSYVRLQNIQAGYTYTPEYLKHLGVSEIKLTLSANNLLTWSNLPHDRSAVYSGGGLGTGFASSGRGNYPNTRRVNLGLNITF